MGYINIPKLGEEIPKAKARQMPVGWKYFKNLKTIADDQAYLFYKGGADLFDFYSPGDDKEITVYGGSDGMTPLYRWFQRMWYRYERRNWVATSNTQTSSYNCRLIDAEPNSHPLPIGLHFSDLTGKTISDPNGIGNTELFTVIVHSIVYPYVANTALSTAAANGDPYTSHYFEYPLVAYSGKQIGIGINQNVAVRSLEFIEITGTTDSTIYNTFSSKNRLQKLEIPDNITSTFSLTNDKSLIEFKIPERANTIANNMFYGCSSLEKVELNTNITGLPNNCFFQCFSLKKIEKMDNITTIGAQAFNQCHCIDEISIPKVTSIGSTAFKDCSSLKKVTLNNNLTLITASVFENCYSLKEINIPTSLQEIGDSAFRYNSTLNNVILPNTLTTIGMYAFDECGAITEMIVPNSVTSIGQYAFAHCYSLSKIILPNNLTTIPTSMMLGCGNLTEITLPNTLETIGLNAFYNNISLRKIEIPSSVTLISNNCLAYCGAILYIKMNGTPPALANPNFIGACNTYLKILIPYNKIYSYKTETNWISTTNDLIYRMRGYKTFNQGETLPTIDLTENYTLTWYEKLDDIINTTARNAPTVTPITVAPYDGEFYCTIQAVS